jgi:hypothetical protein
MRDQGRRQFATVPQTVWPEQVSAVADARSTALRCGPPLHRGWRDSLSPPHRHQVRSRHRPRLESNRTRMVGMASSSSTWSIIGVAALAIAPLLGSSVAASDAVRLRDVDGGPEYYSQFSNSLPSDPNYFPLGVWLESVVTQADIVKDKDVGLNLYVALTANSNLALVRQNGMRVLAQQNEWNKPAAIRSLAVAGWLLFDEIDMLQGPNGGYRTMEGIVSSLPNDGRLRFNNYGKGVMFWETDEEASRFLNNYQQVASNDIYWFTDPFLNGWPEAHRLYPNQNRPGLTVDEKRRAYNYGITVDRMRALDAMDGSRIPIWNVVEVGWPFTESAAQGARTILPAELRAAVWHSIIAGARGIIYFNHSFGGPNPSHHCLRDPPYAAVRAAVKSTNQLITELAPVLNAPFADGFVTGGPAVRTMAKFHDNKYYVFAGSKENRPSNPTFSLSLFDRGTATVIGENRTIAISHGQFSDNFEDGNAIHIYRIDNH